MIRKPYLDDPATKYQISRYRSLLTDFQYTLIKMVNILKYRKLQCNITHKSL